MSLPIRSRYFVRPQDVPPYHPANHTGTVNRRLIGAGNVGANKVEGWGETTALDYEYQINEPTLARWFNDGTWSQSTLGLSWRTGITLYRNLANAKAALAEVRVEGQTDAAVNVSNYGGRLAYRQTLGRKWLLGEVYSGYDWPKSSPGEVRHSQLYGGVTLEILFGHY